MLLVSPHTVSLDGREHSARTFSVTLRWRILGQFIANFRYRSKHQGKRGMDLSPKSGV